jgi:hypothetical protein
MLATGMVPEDVGAHACFIIHIIAPASTVAGPRSAREEEKEKSKHFSTTEFLESEPIRPPPMIEIILNFKIRTISIQICRVKDRPTPSNSWEIRHFGRRRKGYVSGLSTLTKSVKTEGMDSSPLCCAKPLLGVWVRLDRCWRKRPSFSIITKI